MPKGYKKRKMRARREKNNSVFYNNGPYNGENFGNYQYFDNTVPPTGNQYYEPQSENRIDVTPGGSKGSRVIGKRNLYKDPEQQTNARNRPQTDILGYSHNNMSYWQRPSDTYVDMNWSQSTKPRRKQAVKKNTVEKALNEMLAKPVEISKGKSLLEKMGWTGGGLGKDGNGIVNPIVPKAAYAMNTLGLGHRSEIELEEKRIHKKDKHFNEELEFKHNFVTNVLLKILEFVKNNSEVDLLFERSLYNKERKKIHLIVEELRECFDVEELSLNKSLDIKIASEILKHNTYILITESNGKPPERVLRVYKDVPSYVYLVTPDVLRDDENDEFDDFCEPLDIETEDKTDNDIATFTEKVKCLDVENDKTIKNDKQDHENGNLRSSVEKTTVCGEELGIKNDYANVNYELNLEKVSDGEKATEATKSISNVNYKLNYQQYSKTESLESALQNIKPIEETLQVETSNEKLHQDLDAEQEAKNIVKIENSENKPNEMNSQQNSKKSQLGVILDYFTEFVVDTSFLEFRFLGSFNSEELNAINTFFDICLKRDKENNKEKIELLQLLNNELYNFEFIEDPNGSIVVYKSEKNSQSAPQ